MPAIGCLADGGLNPPLALLEAHHGAVALHRDPGIAGCEHQQQIQAGVIELAIAVDQPGRHLWRERGQQLPQLVRPESLSGLEALSTGQQVVQAQAKAVVELLEAVVGGERDAQLPRQKGCLIDPVASLGEGFAHQLQLGRIGAAKGQLQIANTAMQQLGAAGARADRRIMGLQQRHAHATAHSLIGQGGAAAAGTDHHQIKHGRLRANANNAKRPPANGHARLHAPAGKARV